jgi:hypothetical protein
MLYLNFLWYYGLLGPVLLTLYFLIALPSFLGADIIPASALVRLLYIYVPFVRVAWMAGIAGRTFLDTLLIWSEAMIVDGYYFSVCCVMFTYNLIKYWVTCAKGTKKFKSTAANKSTNKEHIFIYCLAFACALVFLACGLSTILKVLVFKTLGTPFLSLALVVTVRGFQMIVALTAMVHPPAVSSFNLDRKSATFGAVVRIESCATSC